MFQFGMEISRESLFRRPTNNSPYRCTTIAFFGVGAERIAGLEGEVFLDAVNGREVVVFYFAQLQEARSSQKS
jgi:hypothetical protein